MQPLHHVAYNIDECVNVFRQSGELASNRRRFLKACGDSQSFYIFWM
jgi:hypothetical protein